MRGKGRPFSPSTAQPSPTRLMRRASCSATRGAPLPARAATIGQFEQAPAARCSSTRSATSRWRPQARCCGLLRSREFERVGGNGPVRNRRAVIAATTATGGGVEQGEVSPGLYYRRGVHHRPAGRCAQAGATTCRLLVHDYVRRATASGAGRCQGGHLRGEIEQAMRYLAGQHPRAARA